MHSIQVLLLARSANEVILAIAFVLLIVLSVLVTQRRACEKPMEFTRHVLDDGTEVFRARGPLRSPQLLTTNVLLFLLLVVVAFPVILGAMGLLGFAANLASRGSP